MEEKKERHGAEHLIPYSKARAKLGKKPRKKRFGAGVLPHIKEAKKRVRAVIKNVKERTVDEMALIAQQIETMSEYSCTLEEMASILGVDRDVIETHFMENVRVGRSRGHMNLRKAQHEAAIRRGSNAMLHWLGKIELEQRERTDKDAMNESLFRKYLDKHIEDNSK